MKVISVSEEPKRVGVSPKTGKAWEIYTVQVEGGRYADCFAPISVGSEVTLTYDEQYKVWKAKLVTDAGFAEQDKKHSEILSAIQRVYDNQMRLFEKLYPDEPENTLDKPMRDLPTKNNGAVDWGDNDG